MKKALLALFVGCLLLTGCGKVEEKPKESAIDPQEVMTNCKQKMKSLNNYTVTVQSETRLTYPDRVYPYKSSTTYQVDLETQKIFNPSDLIYYDMKNKDVYTTTGETSDTNLSNLLKSEKYDDTQLKENLFDFTYLDSFYTVEKISDNQYRLGFKNDNDFIHFMTGMDIHTAFDKETITSKEVNIELTDKYINTISIVYTTTGKNYQDEEYERKEIRYISYNNFKVTDVPQDIQTIYDAVDTLLKKELNGSFTEEINGQEHTFDLTYKFDIFGGVVANAEVSMDNKKMKDYQYMFRLDDVTTLDDFKEYKVSELNKKVRTDNFYVMEGSEEQYIAIYSNLLTEIGDMSKLYVLNDKGEAIITLDDKIAMSIDPLSNYPNHGYTKVEDNAITFYAYRKQDQVDNSDSKITIAEYKLTFEEKPKFERINTYNNIDPSGDVTSFNNVIKE